MSQLIDRIAGAYLQQRVLTKGKSAVGRRLRPHLGEIDVRTRFGALMRVNPRDLIQYSILTTGEWEPEETMALRGELRRGDVVYDIGANVGYFTLLAAQMVGAEGHVYAFEPNPPTMARLRHNVELNHLSNVTLLATALGNEHGSVSFSAVGGANSGASTLRSGMDGAAMTEVPIARLDSVIADNDLRPPNVVKMDIEGAEFMAMRGMDATFAEPSWRSLLIEISDRFLRELDGDEDRLLARLDDAGFGKVKDVSRHTKTEPNGRPFQYTALFRRSATT